MDKWREGTVLPVRLEHMEKLGSHPVQAFISHIVNFISSMCRERKARLMGMDQPFRPFTHT